VIVPARDEESSIRRVIDSLLLQTIKPDEIIVADGGSKDHTKDIIRQFAAEGKPVRLVEDDDALPGRARNLAIRATHSEWIAMTDAGTEIPPDWLEKLILEAQAVPSCDVVYGTYEPILNSVFQECLALAFVPNPSWVAGRLLRGPSTCSMMIKKSVWESLGEFREDLRACEDLLFFKQLKASSFVVRCAPDAVVRWSLPADVSRTFRRFRSYSHHTLKAGLGRSWQVAVARMYAAAFLFVALSVFVHWSFVIVPLLGLAARVIKNTRDKKDSLNLKHRVGVGAHVLIGVILLCIDAAAFTGVFDYMAHSRAAGPVQSNESAVQIQ
jgi:glycosyltransferase involved in cell wall biosynthesis